MLRTLTLFVALAALAAPALGQLQLFQFDGTNETLVGSTYQTASVATGDVLDTRFHLRNLSGGPASLTMLSVAGQGFRISSSPSVPYVIASGQFVEFRVAFSPDAVGSYSATLQVNSISVILRGSAVPTARVSIGSSVLSAGASIDFGNLEWGTSTAQTITLSNTAGTSLLVSTVTVAGIGFQGPTGIATPLTLAPGQSASFQIAFAPAASGSAKGTLTVDQRSFVLTGVGVDPAFPKAAILLASQNSASGVQSTVTVELGAIPKTGATGTLTMEFHPTVSGVTDDAAVQFLSGPQRAATLTFLAGDAAAHFNGSTKLSFQTGTTAGTIIFKLQVQGQSQQSSVTIAPAPVSFDLTAGTLRTSDLDVSLTGFDNTYSASKISFTFYSKTGQALQAPIQVDLTKNFQTYFSSTQVGGSFALRATFPVTGNATTVGGVDVALTNAVGVTTTQRVTF
jgi:hypothetical protein